VHTDYSNVNALIIITIITIIIITEESLWLRNKFLNPASSRQKVALLTFVPSLSCAVIDQYQQVARSLFYPVSKSSPHLPTRYSPRHARHHYQRDTGPRCCPPYHHLVSRQDTEHQRRRSQFCPNAGHLTASSTMATHTSLPAAHASHRPSSWPTPLRHRCLTAGSRDDPRELYHHPGSKWRDVQDAAETGGREMGRRTGRMGQRDT
jgi:hypothetical protein